MKQSYVWSMLLVLFLLVVETETSIVDISQRRKDIRSISYGSFSVVCSVGHLEWPQ